MILCSPNNVTDTLRPTTHRDENISKSKRSECVSIWWEHSSWASRMGFLVEQKGTWQGMFHLKSGKTIPTQQPRARHSVVALSTGRSLDGRVLRNAWTCWAPELGGRINIVAPFSLYDHRANQRLYWLGNARLAEVNSTPYTIWVVMPTDFEMGDGRKICFVTKKLDKQFIKLKLLTFRVRWVGVDIRWMNGMA